MSRVITGDSLSVISDLEPSSVHAVVTDPPYGLAFMGRDWDDFEPKEYQEWCEEWAALCLDVLKPGGHLVAFSGNRTHHRLFSGVEDAGFEVRDTLTWHYGSGFPKALDVSKAIDKAAGVEPESVEPASDHGLWSDDSDWNPVHNRENYGDPTTDAAREWDGFKTALKPATEFIVLARKPFSGTVAENVQAHGTAALNIDGNRIGKEEIKTHGRRTGGTWEESPDATGMFDKTDFDGDTHEGRYPANVIFDAEAAAQLDREVGDCDTGRLDRSNINQTGDHYDGWTNDDAGDGVYDESSGGPSRYYYTSKATRAERTLNGRINNTHPTVKPVDLMEWLVRLVTKQDQRVLDPFCGTGTTLRACKNLGREWVGIEKDSRWADVARARCGLTPRDPGVLTSENQSTLPIE